MNLMNEPDILRAPRSFQVGGSECPRPVTDEGEPVDAQIRDDTVLLAEADRGVGASIVKELSAAGVNVRWVKTLEGAREQARSRSFSAVLVATHLPDGPGYALAAECRGDDPDAPVILLARSGESDDLLYVGDGGRSSGPAIFDDLPVLPERVRRLLRHEPSPATAALRFGPLAFDRLRRSVACHGAALSMTPIEYRLLEALAITGTRGASTKELVRCGWGRSARRSSNVLSVHMGNIRRKLEEAGAPARIESVRNFGYVLRCAPSPDSASPSSAPDHRRDEP
jgi:DNA-binding response OmpR family regulator